MTWLKTTLSEFIGLFVDDGAFALAIIAWTTECGLVLPVLHLPAIVPPLILFIGLLLVLTWSALRRAGEIS